MTTTGATEIDHTGHSAPRMGFTVALLNITHHKIKGKIVPNPLRMARVGVDSARILKMGSSASLLGWFS